ncbi:MAG TPA: type II toxin-antitoxin system VapC family toxin [Candidatus Acidoferrum sp.]|jgi:predicted nucleic acid-binding protein|nr:type II toxin-antitoxin system VapC family toxin [Candidatus Acidoferrum sp.]
MTTAITPNGSSALLIDSSGWLEYLTSDEKAALFAPYLESKRRIVVPTIVIFEVRKILLLRQSRAIADEFVGEALGREVADLDGRISLAAADLGIRHQLPMADAIIYATALAYHAKLITTDTHFSGLPGVTIL